MRERILNLNEEAIDAMSLLGKYDKKSKEIVSKAVQQND